MSKRKKSYNNQQRNINGIYDNYQKTFSNNPQDIFGNNVNWNNIINLMNSEDLRRLNSIIALMNDGIDINNLGNFSFQNFNEDFGGMDVYDNEIVLSFFNSLKPILGSRFGDVIDRFIKFYMDDINKEK